MQLQSMKCAHSSPPAWRRRINAECINAGAKSEVSLSVSEPAAFLCSFVIYVCLENIHCMTV